MSSKRRDAPALQKAWAGVGVLLAIAAVYFAIQRVPAALSAKDAKTTTATVTADSSISGASPAMGVTDVTTSAPGSSATPEDQWLDSEEKGIAEVKRTGKPLVIDFGAEWCAACKELEHKTFTDEKVKAELRKFVKVRLDFTDFNDENAKTLQKYGSKSLPTVAFVSKDGELLGELTLLEFEPPEKFLQRLAKVPR